MTAEAPAAASAPRIPEPRRNPAPILEAIDLRKEFRLAGETVDAVRGVNLRVTGGEFIALMGPSGSGKSTLLQLLGGLDQPTSGEVMLEGQPIGRLSDDEATRLRREHTGFVFQSFNLVPLLNVVENVGLPFTIAGLDPRSERLATRIREAIALVELTGKERHLPDQLSAGEQQRVAVARATVTRPLLLFADEPTGQPRLHHRHRHPRRPVADVRRPRPDRRPGDARCQDRRVRRPGAGAGRRPDPGRDRPGPPRRPRGRAPDRAARAGRPVGRRTSRMRGLVPYAWRSLVARPARTLLTAFGIAIGVAVLMAALAVDAGLDASVDRTVASQVGRADLRVTAFAEAGLSGRTLAAVDAVPGVEVAAPAIERHTFLVTSTGRTGRRRARDHPRHRCRSGASRP